VLLLCVAACGYTSLTLQLACGSSWKPTIDAGGGPPPHRAECASTHAGPGAAMAATEPSGTRAGLCSRRASMVLFGDSLTQRGFEPHGWAAALAHRYGRRAGTSHPCACERG
jgi:hypothetical protein